MKAHAKAIAALEESGYSFARHGANHDIYYNKALGVLIPLKRHDFDESDLRYIKSEIEKNRRRRANAPPPLPYKKEAIK